MAIIEAIQGLEVTIQVDGRPIQEYQQPPDDDDDNNKRVTRYVVAEPGKKFTVKIRRRHGYNASPADIDLVARLSVDGKFAKAFFLPTWSYPDCTRLFDSIDKDLGSGRWAKQNFVFSNLVFDNNESIPMTSEQIKSAKALGEIKMTLKRGIVGEVTGSSASGFNSGTGKVHEKALKGRAMSRLTTLGQEVPITAPRFLSFAEHDKEPFAEFIFRYRSERDLKAEMIIPRSPSPDPYAGLSREDLVERLRDRELNPEIKTESQQRIKRERSRTVRPGASGDTADDEDEVEVVDGPAKRKKVVHIDLTDD